MPERWVIAQTLAQRLRERPDHGKEPIGGGPPSPHPPAALAHLELGTGAGQPVPLQVWPLGEPRGEHGAFVPGGVVDHQHHSGVRRGRISPGHIAPVARTRFVQTALPRGGLWPLRWCPVPLHDPRGQMPGHQVECAEHRDHVMTIQVAHQGPRPFESQRRPPRGAHRDTRFILTQSRAVPRRGCF
jgi:hypothetical protein